MGQKNTACKFHLDLTIRDASTNEPLSFAAVNIPLLNRKGTTDAEGHFSLDRLCAAELSIELYHISCENRKVKLRVIQDLDTVLFLYHSSFELDELQVDHERGGDAFSGHSSVLSGDEVDKNFAQGLDGISQRVAALDFTSGGVGILKPSINGLGGSRVGLIYNGTPLKYQQWGTEHASSVSLFSGDGLEVVDDLGAIKLGSEAFGGAIMVKNANVFDYREPIVLQINTGFNSNPMGNKTSVKLSGHLHDLGDIYYSAGAEINHSGAANTPTGYVSNTGYQSLNYFAHVGKQWKNYSAEFIYLHSDSKQGVYSGAHISNTTDLFRVLNNQEERPAENTKFKIGRPNIQETHEISQIKLKKNIQKGVLQLEAARQVNLRKEFDVHSARGGRDEPSIQLGLTNYNLGASGEWFSRNTKYLVGYNVQLERNSFRFSRIIPEYSGTTQALYAGVKHYFNQWSLAGAIRAETQSYTPELSFSRFERIDTITFKQANYSAYISAEYNSDKLGQEIQIGRSFRFPNALELYAFGIHHGAAEFIKGSTDLSSESAYFISYRAKKNWGKLFVEFNPFFRFYNDFILSQPSGQSVLTISGAFPEVAISNVDINLYGLNLNATYKANENLTASVVVNRVWSENRRSKEGVYGINPGSTNGFLDYSLNAKWSLEYQIQHLYGTGGGRDYFIDDMNIERSKPAIIHGLQARYVYSKSWCISAGVQNIFNETYYRYTNNSRIFYPELGRNFFINAKYTNKTNKHEKTQSKI